MKRNCIAWLVMPMATILGLATAPVYGADFSLSSSAGTWTSTSGGSNINGIGTNEVRWGSGITSDGQSGLRFDGIGSLDFDIDETINLGALTHFNNPVLTAASGATLELSLEFSTPTLSQDFTFSFDIDETPNSEPCTYPSDSGNPCADRITFPASFPTESFSFDGSDYTVELVGFGDSVGEIASGFISQEGGSNTTDLFARITEDPRIEPTPEPEPEPTPEPEPEPTPEPGDLVTTPEPVTLAGLGLIGFYLVRRRLQK